MCLATGVEPTKLTAWMSGSARIASTATRSPCTTLNAPSGSPACRSRSASRRDTDGSFSLGLRMNVLPATRALQNIHIGTIAGKLNGVMPATTPSGWWMEYTSTPVAACSEYPPLSSCGAPQANSTFSSPRTTSPPASVTVLPCSAETWVAISLRLASTSSRNRNITSARRDSEAARQAGNAASAAATAVRTSSAVAATTSACCSPVAGS
jgi:hypothetical protein